MEAKSEPESHSRRSLILLVDDHPAIRESTRHGIEASQIDAGVLEAGTLEAARAVLQRNCVDVVVFDLHLPDGRGTELMRDAGIGRPEICDSSTGPSFVCLTMYTDIRTILQTIKDGARAFLSKESPLEQIILSLSAVMSGRSYFCEHTAKTLTNWIHSHPSLSDATVDPKYQQLSSRERAVFRLLVDGYDTAAMADSLSITKKTVANYRLQVFAALGVSTVRELRLYAEENQIE
jgi:DNA-binding NarL/FixJ family response regulator